MSEYNRLLLRECGHASRHKRLLPPNNFAELSWGSSSHPDRLVVKNIGSVVDYLVSELFSTKSRCLAQHEIDPPVGCRLGRLDRQI